MEIGSTGLGATENPTGLGALEGGEFQEALEMLAATQIVGIIQDTLSYSEKQAQKKKEEERQEGY
jgi:hypothetical protein